MTWYACVCVCVCMLFGSFWNAHSLTCVCVCVCGSQSLEVDFEYPSSWDYRETKRIARGQGTRVISIGDASDLGIVNVLLSTNPPLCFPVLTLLSISCVCSLLSSLSLFPLFSPLTSLSQIKPPSELGAAAEF